MTWQGFLNGTGTVAKVTWSIVLKIFIFVLQMILLAIRLSFKFVFFIIMTIFAFAKLGGSVIDFGGKNE